VSSSENLDQRFRRVLEEYGAPFRRLAAAYERDPDLQQDLLQEIALAVWKALPSFRNQSSERTFLYRVAHNRAVTHISRTRFPYGDLDPALAMPDPSPSPEQAVTHTDRRRELHNRITALPIGLRQVVVLALEGLGNYEIANVLGLSVGNVAVRLHRAKQQLTLGGSAE
jgi:RNA polymerase sigma-70 factor (ECF subfamily)